MHFLRQSTASQEILLGPFVDSTDGSTAETALTINASDIKIWKHGATTEVNKNSGGATHIAAGRYYAVIDATDTDTVGMMEVNISVSGALPVRRAFMVIEEAIYDMLFASSANGDPAGVTTLLTRIGGSITISGGKVDANVTHFSGTAGTFASGRPEVNTTHWGGTAVASATVRSNLINISGSAVSTSSAQIGVNVVNWGGTATGSAVVRSNTLQINSDSVAAQNAEAFFDNSGFNASASTIGTATSVTNAVTAGTVSDKTGYSLSQTFPTNFSNLSIDGAGIVTAKDVSDIKTVADRLNTAIELDGAVYRFTSNALEQAPSSGLDAAGIRSAVGLANANLDTQLGAIQSGVNSILAFDGSTLTAIPWNAAWDAEVQSECADALTAYAPLTTLGANAPAGWINAAAIASSALNGKGDWNVGKTGYSLSSTQSFNLTGNITGNLSGSVNSVTSPVTAGTVSDKTGYSLTQSFPSNFASLLINSSGHISRVTLSDTCTTNTDMRGTDNAALALHWTSTRAEYLDSVVLSTNANQRTVQVTGSHHVAAAVHGVEPDAIDATAIAPSAITAIQAGLATSAALATAQADLDTLTGADGAAIGTAIIETNVSMRKAIQGILAIQAGVILNAGQATEDYAAAGNPNTPRVSANVTAEGNRTSVTIL